MTHSQSSPRGLWAKKRVDIGSQNMTYNSTAIIFSGGIKLSALRTITGNSTAVVLDAGVTVSNARTITANSTGFIFETEAAKPSARSDAKFTVITNSTGNAIAFNTTGTTWKYLNVTDTQPS